MSTNTIKLHYNSLDTLKDLEIYDNRFINSCLLRADQGMVFGKGKIYPVDIDMYRELCGKGYEYSDAFDLAIEAATKLKETSFSIQLPNGMTYVTSLIHEFIYSKEQRAFTVRWNENFIPLISGNMEKGTFMMIPIEVTAMSSNRRYSLYLLIHKYLWKLEKEPFFLLPKEEIRGALGLGPTEYKEFKALNAKIIKPTLVDIYNKLGISLEVKVKGQSVLVKYKGEEILC